MNTLTIYNDRSIRIMDGILHDCTLDAFDVRMSDEYIAEIRCFTNVEDIVLEIEVPPGTPAALYNSVWRSLMRHLRTGVSRA